MKANKNVKGINREVFSLNHNNLAKVFKQFNLHLSKVKANKISNQISSQRILLFLKKKYV
jgi:hypothetical protein